METTSSFHIPYLLASIQTTDQLKKKKATLSEQDKFLEEVLPLKKISIGKKHVNKKPSD